MANVIVKSYVSPTLVLLAMDWDEGFHHDSFLGWAIKRTPGFRPKKGRKPAPFSWLPNRIGFNGPNPKGGDLPSNTHPVQHFQWWDARIDSEDRGSTFLYEVYPVIGPWNDPQVLDVKRGKIECRIPQVEEQGIGTYFNRAVVSSQAFSRQFGKIKTHAQYQAALSWLSNGMNEALLQFIAKAKNKGMAGAAYHLTDGEWVIPALLAYRHPASFVCFYKPPAKKGNGKGDPAFNQTRKALKSNEQITLFKRTRATIMHDKFIVRTGNDGMTGAEALLMGTANFTTEGLTQQANVIHTFESPALSALYLERQQLLQTDPSVRDTAENATWSKKIIIGDATVRVFFAPEYPAAKKSSPGSGSRLSIDAVVNAVRKARSSVFFSLFSATDKALLDACKGVADEGKLMRGLVNKISDKDPQENDDTGANASKVAATWLYERSKEDNMVVGHDSFGKNKTPLGFWSESNLLRDPDAPAPSRDQQKIPPVYVHQKIVIVDGETDAPVIYVGSANMSGNSTWHNDENLLEISKCPRLGKAYVAEFMRLYEQYRARFSWNRHQEQPNDPQRTFSLTKDTSWAARDYKAGTMEFIARRAFAGE